MRILINSNPARAAILWAVALPLTMVLGCAQTPGWVAAPGECFEGHVELESLARARGIYLSEPRAVDGYPELGSSRTLASLDPLTLNARERSDLLERLRIAGAQRRGLLLDMLAATAEGSPLPAWLSDYDPQGCQPADNAADPDGKIDWSLLAQALRIPDDYSTVQRALGLYPLSSLFVRPGIQSLQREVSAVHALPPKNIPTQGKLRRYTPGASIVDPRHAEDGRYAAAGGLAGDSLGLRLDWTPPEVLATLITRHAPVLEVDVTGDFDIPGRPYFDAAGVPRVNPGVSIAYQYPSLMPFAGALRLQLNYVFWFDQRPDGGFLNSLSGALDGLVWRVTLGSAGEVLAYDSIHPCGCYHQFFPSDALIVRSGIEDWPEPPLLPRKTPVHDAGHRGGERIVLRVSTGAHYLEQVYLQGVDADRPVPDTSANATSTTTYDLEPYTALYAVPSARGRQSLFGARGIVPGTQRGERFYLWPMGVQSPGAMRERGRQATAFIGRRHFDDAELFDQLFILRQPVANP